MQERDMYIDASHACVPEWALYCEDEVVCVYINPRGTHYNMVNITCMWCGEEAHPQHAGFVVQRVCDDTQFGYYAYHATCEQVVRSAEAVVAARTWPMLYVPLYMEVVVDPTSGMGMVRGMHCEVCLN